MAVHTYADFSGGWYGTLDPAKVTDNMFDSRNMVLYRDGAVGPRPGLREFNLGRIISSTIHAIDTRRDITQPSDTGVLYMEGTNFWGVLDDNVGANVASPPTVINDALVEPPAGFPATMWHKSNFRTFIHVPSNGGLWRYQQGQLTGMDLSSGSRVGTSSGVRILRDEDGTANLFYSDAADPTTWDPLNFIAIVEDPGAAIVNISELNNYVVIVLDYGGWFMLSGVPGVNDVLRQVYQDLVSPAPWGMHAFVTTSSNELYALSPDNDYPVMFNGTKLEKLQYMPMDPTDPQASYSSDIDVVHTAVTAIHSADTDSPCFILPGSDKMLTRTNGAWGLHTFPANVVSHAWTSNGGRIFGASAVDYEYPDMSVQVVTLGGSGLTSFTLTFDGQTTTSLDDLETAANVEAALEALSSIPTGEVDVAGSNGGPYTVTFSGTLADTSAALTGTPTGGTGTTTITIGGKEISGDYANGQIGLVTDFTLNRPAFTSDTHAQPGDLTDVPVDAWFRLPEKWSESSDPITVNEVVIDLVHYDTGAAEDNNITITVESLARGDEVTDGTQTQTWSIPTADSDTDGVEARIRRSFGNQSAGAGYRVTLSEIRGVKIREIVVVDNEENRNYRSF
jgi:hypothetical protein